jgi:hypothetical protein
VIALSILVMTRFAPIAVACLGLLGGCCINPAYGGGTGGAETPASAEGDAAAGGDAGAAAAPGGAVGGTFEEQAAAAATLDAKAEPLDQLTSIPEKIQAQIDLVLQPINDADIVINEITSLPQRYGLNASELKGMAKASLDGGTVSVGGHIVGQARADVEAVVGKVKDIGVGLKETPKRAQIAVKNVIALGAQAIKLSAGIQAKAKVAFGKKGEDAKIAAATATEILSQIKGQVDQAKATVMGLPARATQVVGKLAASFSL